MRWAAVALLAAALAGGGCGGGVPRAASEPPPSDGRNVFRFDTFGNERFWTDTLEMHEVIQSAVDPTTALSVAAAGLDVDECQA